MLARVENSTLARRKALRVAMPPQALRVRRKPLIHMEKTGTVKKMACTAASSCGSTFARQSVYPQSYPQKTPHHGAGLSPLRGQATQGHVVEPERLDEAHQAGWGEQPITKP